MKTQTIEQAARDEAIKTGKHVTIALDDGLARTYFPDRSYCDVTLAISDKLGFSVNFPKDSIRENA